jgi:hypothetical protein
MSRGISEEEAPVKLLLNSGKNPAKIKTVLI